MVVNLAIFEVLNDVVVVVLLLHHYSVQMHDSNHGLQNLKTLIIKRRQNM